MQICYQIERHYFGQGTCAISLTHKAFLLVINSVEFWIAWPKFLFNLNFNHNPLIVISLFEVFSCFKYWCTVKQFALKQRILWLWRQSILILAWMFFPQGVASMQRWPATNIFADPSVPCKTFYQIIIGYYSITIRSIFYFYVFIALRTSL